MPNHFADIGFEVNHPDDVKAILNRLMPTGNQIKRHMCKYWLITAEEHIELWLHLHLNRVHSFEMHYNSQNEIPVRFEKWCQWSAHKASATAYVWYHRDDDLFPFAVDLPNAGFHKRLQNNDMLEIQVACFAEELTLYQTGEQYLASQEGELKFAEEFFMPTGSFSLIEDKEKKPTANAWFAGHILTYERRTNSLSGKPYHYFAVTCQGAVFDVVAADELVVTEPVIGGILSGQFWLSGRIKGPSAP